MHRGHGWIGRKDRDGTDVKAVVLRDGGERVHVKIVNVSAEGCCLQSDELFRIGEHVSIALPRMGDVRARIRWSLPGSAGTQFLNSDGE